MGSPFYLHVLLILLSLYHSFLSLLPCMDFSSKYSQVVTRERNHRSLTLFLFSSSLPFPLFISSSSSSLPQPQTKSVQKGSVMQLFRSFTSII
ncbi:hypothetical protein VNO78_23714 [Psophocarpus tetragonolobus]|uniref:Uncharacterized protein n=1 Tax=Psophocarpus tetragonolobus TaxID=3891 RepID=A0AAN9XE45_PSOTE